jgi:prepilin-type N-terminal cleavage/methylation domain-containing protein
MKIEARDARTGEYVRATARAFTAAGSRVTAVTTEETCDDGHGQDVRLSRTYDIMRQNRETQGERDLSTPLMLMLMNHRGSKCAYRFAPPGLFRPALAASASGQRGLTLMELLLVIALIGIMSAFGLPRISAALGRQSVQSARVAFVGMYAKARYTAIQRGSKTQLIVVNDVASIQSANPVTNLVEEVGNAVDFNKRYGVTVQPVVGIWTFDSRGLGSGAGQTSVSIAKGTDSTEIVISAAGRVIQ